MLPSPGSTVHNIEVVAAALVGGTTAVIAGRGSVVGFTGAAIVNAANEGGLGGGGVDGAISRAGGERLHAARLALPEDSRGCRIRTGDAVTTEGGALSARFVVHAVGPNYHVMESVEEGDCLLRDAYRASMREAKRVGAETVAFSLLSAGIFRGSQSLEKVLSIGVEEVTTSAWPSLNAVFLCGFTSSEVSVLRNLVQGLEGGLADDNGASSGQETAS